MKTPPSQPRHLLVAVAGAVIAAAVLVYAGPLDPPAGPVAPTMKTLDQVEPRTPVNATNTPGDADSLFRISAPGSYYLTGNITGVAAKHGIEIAASGVTLDLMGFELSGVPGSLSGIFVSGTRQNLVIFNGTVQGWGQKGIDATNAQASKVGPCNVPDNGDDGCSCGDGCQVENVAASGNGGTGVAAADSAKLEQIRASGNGRKGITGGRSTTAINCKSDGNTSDGCTFGDGSNIAGLIASNNTGTGVLTGPNCTITRCTTIGNTADGLSMGAGCRITDGTSNANGGDGMQVGDDCYVTDCTCDGNGVSPTIIGSGIHTTGNGAHIDGNHMTDNERGMIIAGAGNLVIRNTFSGNGTPTIVVTGTHTIGEAINAAGNPGFQSTNAWANLIY